MERSFKEEVAKLKLGEGETFHGEAILAVTKALLVLWFFMHLRYSTRVTVLTAVAGFFWLAILIFLTLNDYATRETLFPFAGK